MIQVAVGYEHQKRGNARGMRSLLRQGTAKLARFTRRPGVRALRERAMRDADAGDRWNRVAPPKVMVTIRGHDATAPSKAIRIEIPAR